LAAGPRTFFGKKGGIRLEIGGSIAVMLVDQQLFLMGK
jgi:hypothetical protein